MIEASNRTFKVRSDNRTIFLARVLEPETILIPKDKDPKLEESRYALAKPNIKYDSKDTEDLQ